MDDRIGIKALLRAVNVLGSQAKVGAVIGAAQTTVSECIHHGQRVPAEWCAPIDRATTLEPGGRVSCHDLRPDLFPKDFTPEPLTMRKPLRTRKRAPDASQRRASA